jgi:hypothetical protein
MPDRQLAAVKLTIPGKYQISAVDPEQNLGIESRNGTNAPTAVVRGNSQPIKVEY